VEKAKVDLNAARLEAANAKTAEEAAKKSFVEADKAAKDAAKNLADATKAVETAKADAAKAIQLTKTDATKAIETAKAETAAVKKAGDDAVKVAEKGRSLLLCSSRS
jgi:hypothetical protein